jgi:hypothetical protein
MTTTRNVFVAGLGLWVLGISACGLIGIEPDDIDLATDESGTGEEGVSTSQAENGGDGDGDATEEGDTTGPDTGETGPAGDGDGDTEFDPLSCNPFEPMELSVGPNDVEVVDGVSALTSECGGAGAESVYQFMAPSEGDWQFVIEESEFTEVLSLVGSCVPVDELACSPAPAMIQQFLAQGEVVFVIVDSDEGFGTATLTITAL